MRSKAASLTSILLVSLAVSAVLHAHMKVEKTEPANGANLSAAPPHVQLWLTEKPDMAVTKLELAGASGKVALGPAHMMGDKTLMAAVTGKMPDGKYTVNWQTAGNDGHLQKGTFVFTVKHGE